MEKINVNNIRLAYTRRGRGQPLVLLHGFPLDHRIWDEVVPALEGKFSLIVPDLRGFGESTTVESTYTMDSLAADVAGLLNHLSIERAFVAGHSMGGYVALTFAKLYPERMLGLALVSSQVLPDPPDRKEGRYATAAQVAENGIVGVVEAMTPKLSPDEQVQSRVRAIMEDQSSAGVVGALKAMAERLDSSELLRSLEFGVVAIHGAADDLIPPERAREVKAALPAAELVELPGVGHMPMLEAPDETAAALHKLLR